MSEDNKFMAPFYTRDEAKKLLDHYNEFTSNTLESFVEHNEINELLKQRIENSEQLISRQKRFISFLSTLSVIQLFLIITLYILIK